MASNNTRSGKLKKRKPMITILAAVILLGLLLLLLRTALNGFHPAAEETLVITPSGIYRSKE